MAGVNVASPQGQTFIGQVVTPTAFFSRPNDTNTYTAGDVISNSTTTAASQYMTFVNAAPLGSTTACIQQATIAITANVAALQPDLQLYLYDTTPPMQADNAAFAATNDQIRSLICIIAFPVASMVVTNTGVGAAGNIICNVQGLVIPFTTVNGSNIYGHLVVRNAYVPVASTYFQVRLNVVN